MIGVQRFLNALEFGRRLDCIKTEAPAKKAIGKLETPNLAGSWRDLTTSYCILQQAPDAPNKSPSVAITFPSSIWNLCTMASPSNWWLYLSSPCSNKAGPLRYRLPRSQAGIVPEMQKGYTTLYTENGMRFCNVCNRISNINETHSLTNARQTITFWSHEWEHIVWRNDGVLSFLIDTYGLLTSTMIKNTF